MMEGTVVNTQGVTEKQETTHYHTEKLLHPKICFMTYDDNGTFSDIYISK